MMYETATSHKKTREEQVPGVVTRVKAGDVFVKIDEECHDRLVKYAMSSRIGRMVPMQDLKPRSEDPGIRLW